jgi:endonuclease/exonuclease/phosphatase family metal-dependent hydrolase
LTSSEKTNKTSHFNRIILFLNYFFIVCLLISYLAPFVSPENFTFIAFFGLAYPVLAVINLLFVFYWLIFWKKKFLLSLLTLLAGWFILSNFWSINIHHITPDKKKEIKVMSYNVRLFDLYNRPFNIGTRNKMFDLVKDESPDIICFQEFYKDDSNTFNTLDTLLQLQKAKNYHAEYTVTVLDKYHFGMATFTTFPIVNRGKVDLSSTSNNTCIYTDIKINSDTIRVYNMHLQSIHLSTVVYKDPKIKFETQEIFENETKNILQRLGTAFSKRAPQADLIAEHMRSCRYPLIICSDLNDTPSSYTYRTVKGNFIDTFKESGMGFGATYAGVIPFLRIDYIFHSPALIADNFNIIPEKLSDHYPICCTIEIPGK